MSFFYSSAKIIDNAVPLPQGGLKRREGLRDAVPQRGIITAEAMGGYTFGAPNGGTAGNVIDASSYLETTTNVGTTTEYVISTIDAGSAVRVSLSDVECFFAGGSETLATLALQSSDDAVTYTTRATIAVGLVVQDRRLGQEPGTDLATARYWRFIIDNPSGTDYGAAVVSIRGVQFYAEAGLAQGAEPGNSRVRRITTEVTAEYFAVITQGNVDILTSPAGVWQACVPIPHTDAQISDVKTAQQRDTLVIYNRKQLPTIVQRLDEVDDRWRSGGFQFDTISEFPFPDSTTGGANEKQELRFSGMSAGDRFAIEFNGEVSSIITWNASDATNASNIQSAINGLEDFSGASVTTISAALYEVEFAGADALTFFPILVVDILTGTGTVDISRTQFGEPNKEPLWSVTRGYPRCGTFYQGRHWMGGFDSRPDVIVASRSGNFADFREDQDPVATSPLVLQPDTDEQVTVENIYPGRNLQIFTSSVEIYVPDEPITPNNIALKVSSKRGNAERTQPVDVQGGTLFVDRNGTNIREYLFTDLEQSYTAEPVSTLGGHLVQQPEDMALRLSVDTDEPTILYIINTGRDRDFDRVPAASLTIDRAQQVTAFARITSRLGRFLSTTATQAGDVAFIVERTLASGMWNYVEILDKALFSDHAREIDNPDVDTFTATASQTLFTYTFSNPADDFDIAVFTREDSLDTWRRVEPSAYTLDTGAKTVTLDTGLDAGTLVAIAKRATSFSTGDPELDGIECYVHADGRAVGSHTPASGSVSINGDEGFFFKAQIGLRMVPNVIMQAYKGQGGPSPTMQRQRIFRLLINIERTSNVAVAMETGRPRAVALTDYDGDLYDLDLEETLFTGTKRISGIGSWETEPRVRITQTEPGPWTLRSAAYDIRW